MNKHVVNKTADFHRSIEFLKYKIRVILRSPFNILWFFFLLPIFFHILNLTLLCRDIKVIVCYSITNVQLLFFEGSKSCCRWPKTCPCVSEFCPEPATEQWSSTTACSVSFKFCPASSCTITKIFFTVKPKTVQQSDNTAAPAETPSPTNCWASGSKQEQ